MFVIKLTTKEDTPREFYLYEIKTTRKGLHWSNHIKNAIIHHDKDSAQSYLTWAVADQFCSTSYLFKEIKQSLAIGVTFKIELCEIKLESLRSYNF